MLSDSCLSSERDISRIDGREDSGPLSFDSPLNSALGPLLTCCQLYNTILHRLPSFFSLGLPVYLVSTARQDKGFSPNIVFALYFAFINQPKPLFLRRFI